MERDEALVSPKRAIALLKDAPEKLDLLLKWCPEKDAARALPGESESIRVIVGRLGTLDRHHYLESARRLCPADGPPGLAANPAAEAQSEGDLLDCELAELLTRFRHVRAQSTAFLESVPEGAWDRASDDAAPGAVTLSRIVADWVRSDAAAFARLEAMCGRLNQT